MGSDCTTEFVGADERAAHLSPREKFEILGAILLAPFLCALDQTVVGTALPVIVTDLHGNNLYTWVVTVYLLTSTISGPIYALKHGPGRPSLGWPGQSLCHRAAGDGVGLTRGSVAAAGWSMLAGYSASRSG